MFTDSDTEGQRQVSIRQLVGAMCGETECGEDGVQKIQDVIVIHLQYSVDISMKV